MMRRTCWTLVVILALLAVPNPCPAAGEKAGWEFDIEPYGWISGSFGVVDVDGRTATIDATLGDILTLLFDGDALAAAGYFAARHDRWSVFVDAYGGALNDLSTKQRIPTTFCTLCISATADLRPVLLDVAVGYQLGQWALPERQRPITIGVYAGARYVHLGVDLDASLGVVGGVQGGGSVSESFNEADPIVGIRWEVPLLDRLSLDFRGDIGGLPTNSKLTWGLVADARYYLSWTPFSARTWLAVGYRVVGFDRDFGSGNSASMQLRGPITGLGFSF